MPPAQDKATTNHPVVLDENPSSRVAACLVAPTRIARPQVRIYTRELLSDGRVLPSAVQLVAFRNKIRNRRWETCFARQPVNQSGHITLFLPAPSVAVRGERAATSVRRLLDPARSLENDRSLYWVAFHLRSPSLQAVWVGVIFFPLHTIFGTTRV